MSTVILNPSGPRRCGMWMIGRDDIGRWVLCDDRGDIDGFFATREEAIARATEQSDPASGAVVHVADHLVVAVGRHAPAAFTPAARPRRIAPFK
ncbi:hypothetical protein QCN27_09170 [Cereibacter sp. SYSU M97828]|nr:hypothetical protein [Cereibacter flavus]